MAEPIRVLVVDDSPLVRRILGDILEQAPGITVAATASNAEIALMKVESAQPDVITMDIEMPGMGGLEAISRIMASRRPVPIIVLSAFAQKGAELTLQALDRGAVDFMAKPVASVSGGISAIASELVEKVRGASRIDIGAYARARIVEKRPSSMAVLPAAVRRAPANLPYDIVAIGTSTGGPPALKTVLMKLPSDFPLGLVIVQHMPPVFTKAFADRLDTLCAIRVKEAAQGDVVLPGHGYIAPGDYHLTLRRDAGSLVIWLDQEEPVNGHRPSVDVTMRSVGRECRGRAIAVIMTGMGKDGAEGIRELKARGAEVIAQDRETSVIFGMNREVIVAGNADHVLPVGEIPECLNELTGVGNPVYAT